MSCDCTAATPKGLCSLVSNSMQYYWFTSDFLQQIKICWYMYEIRVLETLKYFIITKKKNAFFFFVANIMVFLESHLNTIFNQNPMNNKSQQNNRSTCFPCIPGLTIAVPVTFKAYSWMQFKWTFVQKQHSQKRNTKKSLCHLDWHIWPSWSLLPTCLSANGCTSKV